MYYMLYYTYTRIYTLIIRKKLNQLYTIYTIYVIHIHLLLIFNYIQYQILQDLISWQLFAALHTVFLVASATTILMRYSYRAVYFTVLGYSKSQAT